MAVLQENDLTPHACGALYPGSPDYPMPFHFHGQLEFVFVLRGRLLERVGGVTHPVHAGQLIWHLPGVEHGLLALTRDHDFRVVHIEPEVLREVDGEPNHRGLFRTGVSGLGYLIAGRPVVDLKRSDVDALLEDCHGAETRGVAPSRAAARRLLGTALEATRANHDFRRTRSLVELASCVLLDNPSLSRAEVCMRLDVSEGYLSRRFTAELGLSLLEQRTRIRVTRFIELVSREHRNMLAAALEAGFGSYAQFHRVFTRVVGMGPREYFGRGGREARSAQLGSGYGLL